MERLDGHFSSFSFSFYLIFFSYSFIIIFLVSSFSPFSSLSFLVSSPFQNNSHVDFSHRESKANVPFDIFVCYFVSLQSPAGRSFKERSYTQLHGGRGEKEESAANEQNFVCRLFRMRAWDLRNGRYYSLFIYVDV